MSASDLLSALEAWRTAKTKWVSTLREELIARGVSWTVADAIVGSELDDERARSERLRERGFPRQELGDKVGAAREELNRAEHALATRPADEWAEYSAALLMDAPMPVVDGFAAPSGAHVMRFQAADGAKRCRCGALADVWNDYAAFCEVCLALFESHYGVKVRRPGA